MKNNISDPFGFSKLSPEERQEAEENLDRYLELALRIYERIEREKNELSGQSIISKRQTELKNDN